MPATPKLSMQIAKLSLFAILYVGISQQVPSVSSLDDLTPRTPAEKAHAAYFDLYGNFPLRPGEPVTIGAGLAPPPPPGVSPTLNEYLKRILCGGDGTLVGTVRGVKVLVNNKRTFLFTDYEVSVDEWIRSGLTAKTLTISTGGGAANVRGRLVQASVDLVPVLEVGRTYLIFLRSMPKSEGYLVRPPVILQTADQVDLSFFSGDKSPTSFPALISQMRASSQSCK